MSKLSVITVFLNYATVQGMEDGVLWHSRLEGSVCVLPTNRLMWRSPKGYQGTHNHK